jgi:hypothetical protein
MQSVRFYMTHGETVSSGDMYRNLREELVEGCLLKRDVLKDAV